VIGNDRGLNLQTMVKAMRLGTSSPVRVMRANHHLLPDTRLG
jgi:hypothetical protein